MKGKRIISVLVALMLMLSCFAVSASADDAIFDSTKDLSLEINLWTTGSTESSHTGIPNATFIVKDSTDTQVGEVLTTDANGVAVFKATERGTYTVIQQDLGDNQSEKVSSFKVDLPMTDPTDLNKFIYDVKVYPKVPVYTDKPTIAKKVSDERHDAFADYAQSASILSYTGNKANWIIGVTVPANAKNYKTLKVTDILDTRLINPGDLEITYDKAELVEADYNAAFNSGKLVVDLKASGIAKLQDNSTFYIRFTTEIDITRDDAIATAIPNHTFLNFKNAGDIEGTADNTPSNPDDDTNPEDPSFNPENPNPATDPSTPNGWPQNHGGDEEGKDDPYVWTGALNFTKIKKGDASTALSAEFQLYNAATDEAVGGAVTSTDGKFSIVGLKKGSYYLIETKAPEGYQLIGTKIPFEITGLSDAKVKFTDKSSEEIADITDVAFSHGDPSVNYIVNVPSTSLPLTGGMGVGLFAVLGMTFAALGGVYLFKTRKASSDR